MYKIGTSEDLWICRERYPDIFLKPFSINSLKPLGHATVCEFINKRLINEGKVLRVLEIGHGNHSPFFSIFNSLNTVECYGIDDVDVDNTVNIDTLKMLRNKFPNVKFYKGYLGGGDNNELPLSFFDLVFSVSVIEHIPEEQLHAFHKDLFKILRPGGIQLHSYDRPWGVDVGNMKMAIEANGFEWIEKPQREIEKFWDLSPRELARVVFEHPFIVMEKFMHRFPRDNRILHNWVTIITGAKKPF